ncbi:MAG: hypothetical protein R2758_05115 [Bacteroidales bacterium]
MKNKEIIERIKNKKAFISDMDGVIYHGNKLLPGVPEFVEWLKKEGKKFLFIQLKRKNPEGVAGKNVQTRNQSR